MSSEKHLHPAAMLVGAIKTLRRWISGLVFPGVVLLVSQGFSLWTVTLSGRPPRRGDAGGALGFPLLEGDDLRSRRQVLPVTPGRLPEERTDHTVGARTVGRYRPGDHPAHLRRCRGPDRDGWRRRERA